MDEKKDLHDPQAKDSEETEDTEGNIYFPRGGAKPSDGGENPTGNDEPGSSEGENFHPRPFHPRP